MSQLPSPHWLELKLPPPLVALLCGGAIWWLAGVMPASFALPDACRWLAIPLVIAGLSCDLLALLTFRKAQTTINPLSPENSCALVTGGIYRFSRNPMYLGLALLLTAWLLFVGQWLLLPLVALFVGYITRFQIVPEERVLQERFGEAWNIWQGRVRRWL